MEINMFAGNIKVTHNRLHAKSDVLSDSCMELV
ncbi:hypothetical protein HNR33_004253 [Brassicibacter mesophilus]